jgi:hypothetical protein
LLSSDDHEVTANTSDAPCGMYGYPGLSFVTSAGSSGVQIALGACCQQFARPIPAEPPVP